MGTKKFTEFACQAAADVWYAYAYACALNDNATSPYDAGGAIRGITTQQNVSEYPQRTAI